MVFCHTQLYVLSFLFLSFLPLWFCPPPSLLPLPVPPLLLSSLHWVCGLGVIRHMHAEIISSIKNLQLDGEDPRKLLQSWGRLRFPRHVLQWVCRQTWHPSCTRSVQFSSLRQKMQPFLYIDGVLFIEDNSWTSSTTSINRSMNLIKRLLTCDGIFLKVNSFEACWVSQQSDKLHTESFM